MAASKPGLMRHEWLVAIALAWLLMLFTGALANGFSGKDAAPALQPALAHHGADPVKLSRDQGALLLPGQRNVEAVTDLHVVLPSSQPDAPRWVIWMGRNPVDAVSLRRDAWRSQTRGFFNPLGDEGVFPVAFVFPLPVGWHGPVDLELRASSEVRSQLRPQLMREDVAIRLERRGATISGMLYASLFTLALLALALFSAARDRMFLAFFGYATITLLMLAAVNGHLYQMRWFAWFAAWGVSGLLALAMLYSASLLQILLQYCGTRAVRPRLTRAVNGFCIFLGLLAAVFLLDLDRLSPLLQTLAALSWLAVCAASLALLIDAVRRGVHLARWLVLLSLLSTVGTMIVELTMRGYRFEMDGARFGYQVSLVVMAAIIAVGLINRIGEYRDQRDRERLARTDADRRMQREAARSDLNAALQVSLRTCKESEIEWVALRLLLDRLVPHLAVDRGYALVEGYHGLDLFLAAPVENAAPARERLAARRLPLKRLALNAMPLQQPVPVTEATDPAAMEAVVPLQIVAPAWGVLLLERDGVEGFSTEEMTLVGECARLTLTHIEQAKAAISLRRSAELDALTGTFNRRTIDLWLSRSFGESTQDGQPLSLLFVDLDFFKAINDKYGHACGDHCLREVAAKIRGALGDGDLLGRYGGEEFIVVLPRHGGAAARMVAERLRADIEGLPLEWQGQKLKLTVSVGVATKLDKETRASSMVDRADKALYAAKRGGRNCVHVAPAVFS